MGLKDEVGMQKWWCSLRFDPVPIKNDSSTVVSLTVYLVVHLDLSQL